MHTIPSALTLPSTALEGLFALRHHETQLATFPALIPVASCLRSDDTMGACLVACSRLVQHAEQVAAEIAGRANPKPRHTFGAPDSLLQSERDEVIAFFRELSLIAQAVAYRQITGGAFFTA